MTMKSTTLAAALCLCASALVGCATTSKVAPPATTKTATIPEKDVLLTSGKVVEVLQAANYYYLRLEKLGKTSWAAVPTPDLVIGNEVEVIGCNEQGRFQSLTLHRTFKNILFCEKAEKQREASADTAGVSKTNTAPPAAIPKGKAD